MKKNLSYRKFLKDALELKQARNPAYTIGSFGRLFGIEASRMAQILNGKIGISVKRAYEIAEVLKFSDSDKKIFVLLVEAEHERNPEKKSIAQKKIAALESSNQDLDNVFSSISDWHHHALIELVSLNDETLTIESMAKKVGITLDMANTALERLLDLELIQVIPNSNPVRFMATESNRRTGQDIPSEAVKIFHEQVLEKAAFEIRNQPVENRDYSTIMFKFNKDQMEKLKDKLQAFRTEVLEEFDVGPDKDSVYCMSLQLFEITGKDSNV